MLIRGSCLVLISVIAFMVSAGASEWPDRPVKIIYPYAPGSTGDATARLIASRLSEVFKQPFVVENRVGANGTTAAALVARSPADGYTLLWAITPQIAIAPAMMKVSYDPLKDFIPISAISTNRFALVVNAELPVKTVAEFVDYVRDQRKAFTYAEGGTGSITHLAMVLFLNRAGLSGINVSYKGTDPALLDVMAGRLPAMFSLFGDALAQAKGGAVRLLAVSSAERSSQAPTVPTIAESGFSGYAALSWWGLMAPAGTPQAIVDRIAREVGRATRDQKIVAQMTNFGVDPLGNSPAEFAAMISADIHLWGKAVKIAGIEMH